MNSWSFLFCIAVSILCFSGIASQGGQQLRTRRSEQTKSKYIYRPVEESTTTTEGGANENICPVPQHENLEEKRNKRSIQDLLMNSTTEAPPGATADYSVLSPEFLNCTLTDVEPECYQKLPNGSVHVPSYNMVFNRSNYIIKEDFLFICPDFYEKNFINEHKFSESISIVSLVCVVISNICIYLHVIMFILVKKLQNLPGYCLLSLCVALLSAYTCSFIQYGAGDRENCTVLGMFLFYFFLASFFWMNTISYDVWRSIRLATSQLRLTSDRPIMVRFARYSIYSWGMPLVITFVSVIVHYTSDNVKYRLIFNASTCWFAYKQALTVYFASPLFTLLGMNVIFFVSSFYMISQASMSSSQGRSQSGSELSQRLFLSLRLSSVMGFTWIFGIIAAATDLEWFWYLNAICNALQGVFIFFSFTVSQRTRKECVNMIKGRKFSTSPTQTTSSQPVTTV